MDSNITKNLHWSSSPINYMERAKARALATLHDPAPVLTTLSVLSGNVLKEQPGLVRGILNKSTTTDP